MDAIAASPTNNPLLSTAPLPDFAALQLNRRKAEVSDDSLSEQIEMIAKARAAGIRDSKRDRRRR